MQTFPHTHNTILIAQYRSKDGWLQWFLEKSEEKKGRGGAAPSALPLNPPMDQTGIFENRIPVVSQICSVKSVSA